jgi:hypothetical protein
MSVFNTALWGVSMSGKGEQVTCYLLVAWCR